MEALTARQTSPPAGLERCWEVLFSHGSKSSKPFHIIIAVDNDKRTFVLTTLTTGSGFGHDKSQAILPYRGLPNPPTLFFFGDGVSGAHPVLLPEEFCR